MLAFLGEHFADRLPEENFMIYDDVHHQAALHPSGKGFFLTDTQGLDLEKLKCLSPQEAEYQNLWKGFLGSIAVEARENRKLQSKNLPKRFWKNMVEHEAGLL